MILPKLPYSIPAASREIVAIRGINYSDNTQDGDLAACENMSTRRYPYFSTRLAREKQTAYSGVTSITAWGKLVAVRGTDLLYDGEVVGTVAAGEKQFAVVNTKMVIWPDKVYLDIDSKTVKPLGAMAAATKAVFTTEKVTLTSAPNLTERFKAGDAVTITGCTKNTSNNKDVVIQSVTATEITVSSNTFTTGTEEGAILFERRVPDLDFICESENRLWGCSNAARTIYASSLGDPTNFFVYEGLATDAYALAVGSEGDFTGCCKLSTSVLFWKETCLHKMLGSFPAEYSLYTYNIEGLRRGCHKSMQVINEVLFYMGVHGVYAYSGGTPALISAAFGEREFFGGVGGNDGERYYLSVTEGMRHHLLVYDTIRNMWIREDDTRCVDFARISAQVYFLTEEGDVYLADSGEEDPDVSWYAQFAPFYETARGRKRYSKVLVRLQVPKGAWVMAEIRCDGGIWKEAGKVIGLGQDAYPLAVIPARCDKFELRLSGVGTAAILSITREFRVMSER